MKQIKVNVFSFSELPESIRQKVLDTRRHINVNDNFWYETVYGDFSLFCQAIGIEVDREKTYFRGFYSQGDGSCFTASVDLMELIAGINGERWRQHAPNEQPQLQPCKLHPLVMALLQKGIIGHSIRIVNSVHGYSVKVEAELWYRCNEDEEYPRIEEELGRLERWLTDTADDLNRFLYDLLRREYEYHTSDEAVQETLTINDYLFTEDGRGADYLGTLAIA